MALLKLIVQATGAIAYQATVNSGDYPAPGDMVLIPGAAVPGRVAQREFVYGPGAAALVEVRCIVT